MIDGLKDMTLYGMQLINQNSLTPYGMEMVYGISEHIDPLEQQHILYDQRLERENEFLDDLAWKY